MKASQNFLTHPLFDEWDVPHGFGTRSAPEPDAVLRPTQVHGCDVAVLNEERRPQPQEADALLATQPGERVAVVTADCVPILAAAAGGGEVVAIHAGWRGLALGVVGAGIQALRAAGAPRTKLRAVRGPHIGPCCYEVDAPVLDALRQRFGEALTRATRPTQPGHAKLDLGLLVEMDLSRHGIDLEDQGSMEGTCTQCDEARFYSYRRDGPRAGRLLHFIETGSRPGGGV